MQPPSINKPPPRTPSPPPAKTQPLRATWSKRLHPPPAILLQSLLHLNHAFLLRQPSAALASTCRQLQRLTPPESSAKNIDCHLHLSVLVVSYNLIHTIAAPSNSCLHLKPLPVTCSHQLHLQILAERCHFTVKRQKHPPLPEICSCHLHLQIPGKCRQNLHLKYLLLFCSQSLTVTCCFLHLQILEDRWRFNLHLHHQLKEFAASNLSICVNEQHKPPPNVSTSNLQPPPPPADSGRKLQPEPPPKVSSIFCWQSLPVTFCLPPPTDSGRPLKTPPPPSAEKQQPPSTASARNLQPPAPPADSSRQFQQLHLQPLPATSTATSTCGFWQIAATFVLQLKSSPLLETCTSDSI